MSKYIMALDAGTTSNRCILFDREGHICSMAQKEFNQYFPKAGWVEQDATEIWSTMLGLCSEAMAKVNASASDIAAIGITNQRETTIIWDKKTGDPVYRAIVWQCRRTADLVDKIKEKGYGDLIQKHTGLVPDPYFSATKIRWILDHIDRGQERAEKGELAFGTVDSWLVYNLSRGKLHVTDYSNASRTMLYNIHNLTWDKEIMDILSIPEKMFPQVVPTSSLVGYTAEDLLGGPIPIAGLGGDQQCALFGQACFDAGEAKNTYGTGAFLLMNTGHEAKSSKNGLVTTIAWGLGEEKINYALEGSIFVAGSSIQWLRDSLRILDQASDSEYMATRVKDSGGCYLVPAFTGLGAPYWDPYARGTLVGLSRGTTKYHIIRATLEAQAYMSNDVLRAMSADATTPLKSLKVDGGASANNFLMQFQADMSQVEVLRPQVLETTALGAAYFAGLAVKFWQNKEEIRDKWVVDRTFKPVISIEERDKRNRNWQRALKRSLNWALEYEE